MSPEPGTAHPPGAWPRGFAATDADRDALLVLSHLDGLTPRRLRTLAAEHGSAARCLRAIRSGEAGTPAMRAASTTTNAADVLRAMGSAGARAAFPGDSDYVARLLDLHDPPACLFLRGAELSTLLAAPAVAIVGARRCSAYGREIAGAIASAVAAQGLAVVSGAALGIDAAAHRGALDVGGPTVAILGSGIDVHHPRSNRELIEAIGERGALVTEYPPGRPALPRQFPARNRIVAALATVVVVVEGAEASGSLITAEFALDLGREVLAVPGPVTSPLSRVPHDLIREGATLVRSPEDVVEAVAGSHQVSLPRARAETRAPDLAVEERRVLGGLAAAATVDGVASAAGLPVERTLSLLAGLELRGLVRSAGGRYERTAASLASV